MADILFRISNISLGLAAGFLFLSVLLWFVFGIPGIIGDLSGRTAKKSIAKMRENNEKTVAKTYRPKRNSMRWEGLVAKDKDLPGLNREEAVTEKLVTKSEDLTEGTVQLEEEITESLLEKTEVPTAKNIAVENWRMLENIMLIHTNEFIG